MIFKICAYALCSLVVIMLLKEIGSRSTPLIAVSVLLLALSLVLPLLEGAREYLVLFDSLGLTDASKTILKLIGLGYLVGIVVDICKEMGEGLVAKAVLIVGRIEIVLIAAPYFLDVIRIGVSLI